MSCEPVVTLLTGPTEMAEGPYWCSKRQSVYFIEMWKREVHRYTPCTGEHRIAKIDGPDPVTFIMPVDGSDDEFIIGYGNKLAEITWDGESEEIDTPRIKHQIDPDSKQRLNDAKISPSGVLFIGSMGRQLPDGSYPRGVGKLYVHFNGETGKVIDKMNIPNGMAWSQDERTYYIADSDDYNIVKYDYNPETRDITNAIELFKWTPEQSLGFPDGFTIDEDDHLWVATFNGQSIVRIHGVTGEILQTVHIPAYQVTSAVFGGPDLSELYVTTAAFQISDKQKREKKLKSGLYKIENLGVKGTKSIPFSDCD